MLITINMALLRSLRSCAVVIAINMALLTELVRGRFFSNFVRSMASKFDVPYDERYIFKSLDEE